MDGAQKSREDPDLTAEISALADGTLDPARRAQVQARIDASPELRRRLDQERRAVALLTEARERDRAPHGLRERVERARTDGRSTLTTGTKRSRVYPGRLAGAAAVLVLVVALALILPAGSPSTPSVARAAALGTLGATHAPPPPQLSDPVKLRLHVGTLHFPNWARTIGWSAVGQRHDRLDGRPVPTVYYARAGSTVAYSIVSGSALPRPPGVPHSTGLYPFQSFRLHGRNVVTWREDGHTCLLSGARVPVRVLASLIAYA